MKIITMKYLFRHICLPFTIAAVLLLAQSIELNAQSILPAWNTIPPSFDLPFCNGTICPTAGQTTATTTPVTLNADMVTIEDNGIVSACYPGYWGINTT